MSGLGSMAKAAELKQRLWFVLGALVVFRIGTYIPVPGIDLEAFSELFAQQEKTILDMFNMFSGGALERFSVFALGVMPYISASIIMQLMTAVIPALEQIKKEGEAGRRKISKYTRYGTVVLATFQSVGIAVSMTGERNVLLPGIGDSQFIFVAAVTFVTGTIFLMWLGEQITERGIGNGISILIFAGIVAGFPSAIGGTLEMASNDDLSPIMVLVLLGLTLLVTGFVVFVERGQRRITVKYAKRQQGRKLYAAQTSHLPLKLNMAGVIPPIFASAIILFPTTIGKWVSAGEDMGWLRDITNKIAPGEPMYVIFYAVAIIFFCFFYTALMFNPKEIADNLKKSGAYIPGYRPGEQTARYIDSVTSRLTFAGAIYITSVCLLPEFLTLNLQVPFYFGGTSLLIIVVVVMDFMAQVQAHLMSQQYDGLMKKANLKGSSKK